MRGEMIIATHDNPSEGPDPYKRADAVLAKRMIEALERVYTGHRFRVEADHKQGMAYVSLPVLMGANHKYGIYITSFHTDPMMRKLLAFAGEILERYGMRRGKLIEDEYVTTVLKVPKHLRGTHGFIPE